MHYLFFFLALSYGLAFAGNESGGGGDVVILPDDSVVLADPWINTGAAQPNNMPPLRAMNPRLLQLAGLYLNTVESIFKELSPDHMKSEIYEEMKKLSFRESGLRFYAVQSVSELNDFCASGGRKTYNLPEGHVVSQVACTSGSETFLVEPLFLRLSLKDQVLLLVHERLTTLRDKFGGKNYSAIARLTTGLGEYVDVYKKEAAGVYPVLTNEQTAKLTNLYIAIEEIQYRDSTPSYDSFQWVAHPNGGGRVHSSSTVPLSTLVTIDSKVNKYSKIGENSKVIHTILPYHLELGDSSVIENSEFNLSAINNIVRIGTQTSIINSKVLLNSDVFIDDQQVLKNGGITQFSQDNFFPLGAPSPDPIVLNWKDEEEALVIAMFEKDIQEGFGKITFPELHVTPTVKKRALFGHKNEYNVKLEYSLKILPVMDTSGGYYVLNNGKVSKAGFKKRITIGKYIISWYFQFAEIVFSGVSKKLDSLGISHSDASIYKESRYMPDAGYTIIFPSKD